MKVRYYLAIALATLIIHGVTLASCREQRTPTRCNPIVLRTCEPE